jgi:hypothetical protein
MNFDRQNEELTVYYFHETEDGVFTGQVDVKTYRATSNLPTLEQEPDPLIWSTPTEAGVAPSRFWPGPFPSGTFNITNTQDDHDTMGTVVRTDAQVTHPHQVEIQPGVWVDDPTGDTLTDGGFNLHSGSENVDAYTWGCIRLSDADMQEVKDLVDAVLDNRPGQTEPILVRVTRQRFTLRRSNDEIRDHRGNVVTLRMQCLYTATSFECH